MIYKAFEYAADTAEIENYLKFDQVTPILASAATGVFYKSTGACFRQWRSSEHLEK